ncbi:hypothetical protein [Enterococcus sp. AZ163]|uniref:hypothetical protein n=1 Tax=Enterococcus sp. AZ163 TaxID=2774638 RepID=UPI003D27327E
MKKSIPIASIGIIAVALLTACEKNLSSEIITKLSEKPATLLIHSTDEGGQNNFDSTGRLQLESYQRAQRLS